MLVLRKDEELISHCYFKPESLYGCVKKEWGEKLEVRVYKEYVLSLNEKFTYKIVADLSVC